MRTHNTRDLLEVLRSQAEATLLGRRARKQRFISGQDFRTLVHELEVHQIELEMQNEELRRSQLENEESRVKYEDLFDFAPFGYFTLDLSGVILEANATGASLFQMDQKNVVRRGFRRFVRRIDQPAFLTFYGNTLRIPGIQSCQVKLVRSDGTTFHARLTALSRSNGSAPICQLAVVDISDWIESQSTIVRSQAELEIEKQDRLSALGKLEEQTIALKKSNDLLQVQIHERRAAEESAYRQTEQMEGLSRRLLKIQEAERRQLALDLHDQLGQVLTGIRLNLQHARRETKTPKANERLAETITVLDGALSQVRQWSFDLRPPLLDDLGLPSALRWYLSKQGRGFPAGHLKVPRNEKRFPSEIEITCFRVAQEALTNVARHARAKNVWIELRHEGKNLQLQIRDDGVGFNVVAARSRASGGASLGLLGMNERLRLVQGKLEITSTALGTTVLATVPIPVGKTAEARQGKTRQGKARQGKARRTTPIPAQRFRPSRESRWRARDEEASSEYIEQRLHRGSPGDAKAE